MRIFAGNGLMGYAFEISNKSSNPMRVDVSRLSLGNENAVREKPILLHSEKETLEACGLFSKPECKTRIFVVARGDTSMGNVGLGLRQKVSMGHASGLSDSKPPFVRSDFAQGAELGAGVP